MAKQSIGVGSASNDGTGDTLRQGATKVNANFNEIYSVFGDANNLVSFAKTSGISSDSNKLGGQSASFYTNLDNLTSGSVSNSQLPVEISGKRFQGQLTGDVVGIVTGSLVGTASSSVRSALAYGLTATPDITVGDITATTLTGNVVGDITGTAGYAHTAGLGTYAFVAGLSTDSQRSVYSQLAGVSTVSGYATTAGIATLAVNSQGLIGTPDVVVGLITATTFKGDGSQITGVVASSAGILIKDNDSSIGIAATVNFGYGSTVSPLSAGIVTVTSVTQYDQLEITGVSTFSGDIKPNGNIVGDNNTVISGIASAYITDLYGNLTGDVVKASQPNITSLGSLTTLNVSGDVSIGGTLTYEDVTNIDSVGLITARSGIVATGVVTATSFSGPLAGNADTATSAGTATTASNANLIAVVDESTDTTCSVLYSGSPTGYIAAKTGSNLTFDSVTGTLKPTNLDVTGISTVSIFNATGISTFDANIRVSGNNDITLGNTLRIIGSNGGNTFIDNTNGGFYLGNLNDSVFEIYNQGNLSLKTNITEQAILCTKNGSVALYHDGGNKKLETTSSGAKVTGILTATTFSGSGASLSNIPASAISGGIDARPNFQADEYLTRTSFSFGNGNWVTVPGLSCTITPTNSNSKIIISILVMGETQYSSEDLTWGIRRAISGGSATDINYSNEGNRRGTLYCFPTPANITFNQHPYMFWYVDTPGTTNAITYTPRVKDQGTSSNYTFYINQDRGGYNYASYRVGGSRMTVMEVKP